MATSHIRLQAEEAPDRIQASFPSAQPVLSGACANPIFGGPGGGLELTMIVVELMFAIMLAAAVLIVIPLLLLMAGVAGVVLLWALAPTAVLVGLVLWLVFPHAMAVARPCLYADDRLYRALQAPSAADKSLVMTTPLLAPMR